MAFAKNPSMLDDALLPDGQRRWRSFGAGFALECLALTVLVVAPMLMPQQFVLATHDWVTPIAAPIIQPWKPQPVKPVVVKREVARVIPKPEVVVPPKPQIYNPVITKPVLKRVVVHKEVAPEVAKLDPPISMGSSAIPTLKKPREAVQTGGFGDPHSVPDNGKRDANPNMVKLGGYDMPEGPGNGNGTGGAKGARGVVASVGFGDGVAVAGPGGPHGAVQQGAFADQSAAAPAPKKQAAVASNTKPVEVLFVPKPGYTDEARNKKIEGDVLLQVVFSASGEVRVGRVVRGLGYGLDESAESAARQIRFHPAQQDGQPVDSPAVVHITFELAY
jgi:TonB family protein